MSTPPRPTTAHPWVKVSAVASYLFLVAVTALLAWALSAKVGREATARHHAVIAQVVAGCERNVLRAGYSRIRARTPWERRATRAFFRIVDCTATYRSGAAEPRTVYLPPELERCWLRLTRKLYWPKHPVVTDAPRVRAICARTPAG